MREPAITQKKLWYFKGEYQSLKWNIKFRHVNQTLAVGNYFQNRGENINLSLGH